MTLKTYRVFAKREEYYCTEVEAESEAAAWEQIDDADYIDWEPLLEGGNFEPYELQEEES
tara:strand:- start:348 stop:527 length:180 start_codon:yes stop_codon:yes gene_type:complete